MDVIAGAVAVPGQDFFTVMLVHSAFGKNLEIRASVGAGFAANAALMRHGSDVASAGASGTTPRRAVCKADKSHGMEACTAQASFFVQTDLIRRNAGPLAILKTTVPKRFS